MKVIIDVNVFVSAILSQGGIPAKLIRAWQAGAFELLVSSALLAELQEVLAYPKLQDYVLPEDAEELLFALGIDAQLVPDPEVPPTVGRRDRDNDYLVALAESAGALIVTGDRNLLSLAGLITVTRPSDFYDSLVASGLI